MWNPEQYRLLDFGAGRRLERFGAVVLDRPCPTAEGMNLAAPELWTAANARFDSVAMPQPQWTRGGRVPATWMATYGSLVFELKPTDSGQVGLFPEQAENWDWIKNEVARRSLRTGRPPKVLNLFGYTGGSTLAAAAAGAEVTHVDAARSATAWAKRNAELSGLGRSPIRWIAEDAMKFTARELRRGNRYDAVVLDPPSYGHGARGESWQLARHLPELLAICAELTAPAPLFVLLTCHTPGYSPARLDDLLRAAFPAAVSTDVNIDAAEIFLRTSAGRGLPCGVAVRLAAE